MTKVIFYEKPGCGGNARQKALLVRSGHAVEARSLLATAWTTEPLRSFFGARPVAQWFNMSSPRVKSGEVNPAQLSAEQALALMIADPLLIRRPLIEANGRREVGFDANFIDDWIGLVPSEQPVTEQCIKPPSADASPCQSPPMGAPTLPPPPHLQAKP